MPRYFFHLYNDITSIDQEGVELPDQAAAHAHGTEEARAMAADSALHGKIDRDHHIDIVDDQGRVVETICFGEAVAIVH